MGPWALDMGSSGVVMFWGAIAPEDQFLTRAARASCSWCVSLDVLHTSKGLLTSTVMLVAVNRRLSHLVDEVSPNFSRFAPLGPATNHHHPLLQNGIHPTRTLLLILLTAAVDPRPRPFDQAKISE